MLHVFRHYWPLRRALLLFSETALLWMVVAAGMSSHLWVLKLGDVAAGTAALDTRRRLAFDGLSIDQAVWRCALSSLMVVWLAQTAIAFNELYDFRLSSSRYERAARFIGSAGSAIGLSLAAVALAQVWELERVLDFPGLPFGQKVVALTFSLGVGFALLYAWRVLFHFLLRRYAFNERILILGDGPLAQELEGELSRRHDSGFEVVADAAGTRESLANGALLAGARALRVDAIAVALADRRAQLPIQELLACRMAGVHVVEAEALFERVSGKLSVEALRPSRLVFDSSFSQHPLGLAAKRALDVAIASLMLLISLPIMLVTAMAVRASSPGTAVFAQERTGRFGRPFTLYKFRSMRADAERATGPVWAVENDPRITPLGRFLRKARIDELPQLFNVLLGDMSLVGPRPERPVFVDELSEKIPYYGQRHVVKPGVTGWAQINYPYGNTIEDAREKLQYDLFYIKNQSLLFDLSILFTTIKTVVLRRGT